MSLDPFSEENHGELILVSNHLPKAATLTLRILGGCLQDVWQYYRRESILGEILYISKNLPSLHWSMDNNKYCYIAGNVFPTVHALIGYFEVTWHLTIKLFPAKISEQATLQKNNDIRG